jgi:hypothetical protein
MVTAAAQAEIFRWLDENGNVQFVDRPPVSSNAKRIKVEVNSYEGVTVKPFEAFKRDGLQTSSGVVIYSTAWCGVCKRARRFYVNGIFLFRSTMSKTPVRENAITPNSRGTGCRFFWSVVNV